MQFSAPVHYAFYNPESFDEDQGDPSLIADYNLDGNLDLAMDAVDHDIAVREPLVHVHLHVGELSSGHAAAVFVDHQIVVIKKVRRGLVRRKGNMEALAAVVCVAEGELARLSVDLRDVILKAGGSGRRAVGRGVMLAVHVVMVWRFAAAATFAGMVGSLSSTSIFTELLQYAPLLPQVLTYRTCGPAGADTTTAMADPLTRVSWPLSSE